MSANLLVVNADGPETRVALIEKGVLSELFIERKKERGIVGNIYKGRVVRVLPGMQAAFVDIGVEKAAFLYVADVRGGGDFKTMFGDDDGEHDGADEPPREDAGKSSRHQKIEDLLKEGQEVLVQVAKEPMGTKGARITSYVSLPGRHLVFMPTVDHIGISRRIGTDKERKRLREIIDSQRPKGAGFIVRTVAEGATEKELRDDMDFLIKLWREILRKNEKARPASMLYSDLDLLLRIVRDNLTEGVDKLIVDSKPEFERVQKFVAAFMPQFQGRVELYEGKDSIFDGHGIEVELDRAIERKVWLKSGGYLIIDQGEALTAIDVNTGKFVGKRNLEETITKNNLEACREVADQLRLRNIGGIIVVDFIDMDKEQNREKVFKAFQESLKADRAKSNVSKISELGLVEMTRKRTRESLARKLTEACFYCEGKGYLKSKTTICYEILREVRRQGDAFKEDTIVVQCHPEIAELLSTSDMEYVEQVEKRLQKKVMIKARGSFHLEHFEIIGKKASEKQEGKPGGGEGRGEAKPGGEGRPPRRERGGGRGERGGERREGGGAPAEAAPEPRGEGRPDGRENKDNAGDEGTAEARRP
jgi:ribonuclease G